MIWAIGDLHGHIPSYEGICNRIHFEDPNAITFQVGDLGLGFRGVNMPSLSKNDFFIAGNHDNSEICKLSKHYLGNYGCKSFQEKKIFWMGGAKSTDRAHRTEGEDWWSWEELSMEDLILAVNLYEKEKPEIVITHDCPSQIRYKWFEHCDFGKTVQALGTMFKIHQPKFWCFGHHHRSIEGVLNGTYFRCLNELEKAMIVA